MRPRSPGDVRVEFRRPDGSSGWIEGPPEVANRTLATLGRTVPRDATWTWNGAPFSLVGVGPDATVRP